MIEKILERLETVGWIFADYYPDETAIHRETKKYILYDEVVKIVQEAAKEYVAGNNDLMVVSALPSLYPLQPFEEEAIHKVIASAKDGGWIPVTERLPEKYRICWITWKVDGYSEEVYRATCYKWGWFCIDTQEEFEPHEVVAWKYYEKPVPYQKGE